jgi:hypothetical protein
MMTWLVHDNNNDAVVLSPLLSLSLSLSLPLPSLPHLSWDDTMV